MTNETKGSHVVVYVSPYRPDCTAIKTQLKRDGISAETEKHDNQWCVLVPHQKYNEAHRIVWG